MDTKRAIEYWFPSPKGMAAAPGHGIIWMSAEDIKERFPNDLSKFLRHGNWASENYYPVGSGRAAAYRSEGELQFIQENPDPCLDQNFKPVEMRNSALPETGQVLCKQDRGNTEGYLIQISIDLLYPGANIYKSAFLHYADYLEQCGKKVQASSMDA